MNYCCTISGEVQTKDEWMSEIISEEYHKRAELEIAPEEYFMECLETGGLVEVE